VLLRVIGKILPNFNMRTDCPGPMRDIETEAVAAASRDAGEASILAAHPYPSFAYADVPQANAGVLVTCEDEKRGAAFADHVAVSSWVARSRPAIFAAY
jgi:microcystin degradation protein MlrC